MAWLRWAGVSRGTYEDLTARRPGEGGGWVEGSLGWLPSQSFTVPDSNAFQFLTLQRIYGIEFGMRGNEELSINEANVVLAKADLTQELGRKPRNTEIAARSGVSSLTVPKILARPHVQRAFTQVLREAGFDEEKAAVILKEAAEARVVYRGEETLAPDHPTRLASLRLYGEFAGLVNQVNVNIVPTPFANLSDEELSAKLLEAAQVASTEGSTHG